MMANAEEICEIINHFILFKSFESFELLSAQKLKLYLLTNQGILYLLREKFIACPNPSNLSNFFQISGPDN